MHVFIWKDLQPTKHFRFMWVHIKFHTAPTSQANENEAKKNERLVSWMDLSSHYGQNMTNDTAQPTEPSVSNLTNDPPTVFCYAQSPTSKYLFLWFIFVFSFPSLWAISLGWLFPFHKNTKLLSRRTKQPDFWWCTLMWLLAFQHQYQTSTVDWFYIIIAALVPTNKAPCLSQSHTIWKVEVTNLLLPWWRFDQAQV